VIALLAHVAAAQGPIKVSAVAAALDLPSSTVHRLIGQFVGLGLLKRLPGSRHYTTGTEALRLGALLSQHDNIVDYAMPHLHRIVQACGESCALGLYRESDATMFFAAQVHSAEPLRYHIDLFRSEPVLWGASGRAILAYLPTQLIRVLQEGHSVSPTGVRSLKLRSLEEQLALVRTRGYSVSGRGERVANASGVAVPVFGIGNRVVGCLALTIPNIRYAKRDEGRLAAIMKAEGGKLSEILTRG
jgi:DNA-binding IclR family transcriptional regulator